MEEDPPAAAPGGESAPLSATLEPPPPGEGSGTEDRGPLVLFIGTSLTEGLGLPDPASEAWPARLAALGREAGIPLRARNAGLSGETSAGALRRIGWLLEGDGPRPDVVVVETGANDGLRGLPVEELEDNLDALLARIREAAPRATLVVVGMEAPPNLGPAYVEAFRQVFPRVAARWDAVLVPFLLEGVAGEASLNQDDGIHPTPEGHQVMAQVAWPHLREVVREAGRGAGAATP